VHASSSFPGFSDVDAVRAEGLADGLGGEAEPCPDTLRGSSAGTPVLDVKPSLGPPETR